MKFKRVLWIYVKFLLFIFVSISNYSFGAWAVRSGVDLTIANQAILPMSGPTAVIGLNLSCNASPGWPQLDPNNGIFNNTLNYVSVVIINANSNHSVEPEDFRKVAIYRDIGTKGSFDPSDFEIGSVDPRQLGSLSFNIPIDFLIPDSDDAQNGTQGPDLWVVIFTSDKISGDMPGGYDARNMFEVRVGFPLAGIIETNTIICDSRVVDLVPMRSDTYDPSSPLEINGYPTISGNPPVFNKYLYGPLYLYRAYAQDHPLDGVAKRIDDALAVPELCGLCVPYRVLGFSLKGRSTYSTNDNEVLSRVTLIIEDTGEDTGSISNNFDVSMLASHLLSPSQLQETEHYSNIAIYRDNGDGNFDPASDTRLIAANVIPGTPHMEFFSLPSSPEGNRRWRVTFEHNDTLDKVADGNIDYFVVIATDPSHGWVTNRPWYGSDFKIYIDPSVFDDGIVVTRPIGESPDPSMYLSQTLIRTRDNVKDVRIALDIKPNFFDGPIEADGVPMPIFYINMTDSWGPFARDEALQWIRVWFKGIGGFKPNKLMPLSDNEDSGVSLWLDSKTGGTIGLPDSRTITENDMLYSTHRVTIADTFVPLDTSSLEWYNSDGTKWSPTNDDPANPNDDDKRYFVDLKPKNPIPLPNDDFIQGNDYPGMQSNIGHDLFICIKPRGISVPETGYKSSSPYERGIDYGMRVYAAIGLTKNNDRPSIINNNPWEDIMFTNGEWARIFPDENRDGIYEPIEAISYPATVPTFFTNLTYPNQSINKFTKTPIIGINLVAPPGKNISFDFMSLIIIDDNNPPTLAFPELVKPNSDPNDPDGGCGIALYKDTNKNGIFDPLDKRVWMTKLPYLLPRAADDPQGRFRIRMEFGDPPQGYENYTSVGYIPTDDTGQNAGPDYFLVIQPNENMDPGDRFHILLWGSDLVGESTLNFTGDAWGITYKRVRTYTLTNTTVTSTIFTDLTTSGQTIDASSDPVGVIGISAWDPTGTNQLQKIRVYFNPKEGLFPDDTPFPTIIANLTNDITSGISIWRDTTNDNIFNWRQDTILPTNWSSWKSDYADGFVDGDGTSDPGPGYKTDIQNWQGKILSYFSWDDKVYWYDANNDSIWSSEDCLWIDEDEDGIFNPQTDKIIVGPIPPTGTFGEKLHEGTFGFVYYDEDQDGKYTDGDDIYFVGRGRRCLGWYAEGILSNVNLPQTNTGNEFFVVIRTSDNLLYQDIFSVSLPSNCLVFTSGYSFANINLTTNNITGNVNLKLTDLIPSNNYVVPPTYDCPAIGINLFDGKRDETDGERYLKEIVVYYNGNLSNLASRTTDGSRSGLALYKESGINSGWDAEDIPINLKSISFSGNKVILTLPDNIYPVPDDDAGTNSGDDFYIVLRTSENARTGDTFEIEIRNDLSLPIGLVGDRIKFDIGTSGEYIVGTNSIQIPILNAPQIISANAQFVNGKWQVVLNWIDNSSNPNEDGFEIQRRIGTTGTWQTIGQAGQDITTYTDDNNGAGLTPDTTYYYRIRAFITTPPTYSAWSNIVSVTTSTGVLQPPSNLTGSAEYVNGKWRIILNWVDNSSNPNEDGFEIERDDGNGFNKIGEAGQDITTYIDDNNGLGLTENKTYIYRVRAYRQTASGTEYSSYSNTVSVTTTRPDKPTNILPSPGSTNVSITPTLQASDYSHPSGVSFASSQWQIRLEQDQNYLSPVYDSGEIGAVTSHQVPSGKLSFGTKYYWHVRYKDSNGGWSDWSDETYFTTRTNSPPNTPSCQSPINGATGITLTPTLTGSNFVDPDGDTQINSQWRLWESGGSSSNPYWQNLNAGAVISISVTTQLQEGKTYYWQVRYQDSDGIYSEWSEPTYFTTLLLTPTGLTAIGGEREVDLRWDQLPPSTATCFEIYSKHPTIGNPNPSYSLIKTVPADSTTCVDSPIYSDSRPYYYVIKAVNQQTGEVSGDSNPAWAIPTAFPFNENPTNLQAYGGWNNMVIKWSDNTQSESYYYVEFWKNRKPDDVTSPDSVLQVIADNVYNYQTGLCEVIIYDTHILWENARWYIRVRALHRNALLGYSWYARPDGSFPNKETIPSGLNYDQSTKYFYIWIDTAGIPSEQTGGGCFVASVCFGENNWQVKLFKEFRDKYLVKNILGREFVKFYYRHSPAFAEFLRNHRFLIIPVKIFLYFILIFVFLILSGIFPYLLFSGSLILLIKKIKY